MLVIGAVLLIISILLALGHIGLLHDYHKNNVKDEQKKKYCLFLGLSLSLGSLGMIASGIYALINITETSILNAALICIVPLFVSIVLTLIIIKIFNKKIFG